MRSCVAVGPMLTSGLAMLCAYGTRCGAASAFLGSNVVLNLDRIQSRNMAGQYCSGSARFCHEVLCACQAFKIGKRAEPLRDPACDDIRNQP